MMDTADFLVIGAGIIGVNIAIDLKARYPDARIVLIEKESDFGLHASGRNSGVLHAGFYYTSDSLKARYTKNGNSCLREYCERKRLPINSSGKLVVARNEHELDGLEELVRRGSANGIELIELDEKEAREIEPKAKTFQKALFSPTTATVDPKRVLASLVSDAVEMGVVVYTGARYLKKDNDRIITTIGRFRAGYIVNAAGLYADTIAREFGFCERYSILPFKGLYLYSNNDGERFRTNIYPVPELKNPFLGVHITLAVNGTIKIGPTAIPALWREQYSGVSNFKVREFIDIASKGLSLSIRSGFDFGNLAISEFMKYSRTRMISLASSLLTREITNKNGWRWGSPGIRAQLVDNAQKRLVMDFIVEGDDKSMHVLNAVSPAFTCSIPFSKYIGEKIHQALS